MSRYPRSKFGFALTSMSKKGLLTALSTTTVLGMLVFLVAIYAEGPVAAKRLQHDFDASVAKNPPKNRRQSAGQSLSARRNFQVHGGSGPEMTRVKTSRSITDERPTPVCSIWSHRQLRPVRPTRYLRMSMVIFRPTPATL